MWGVPLVFEGAYDARPPAENRALQKNGFDVFRNVGRASRRGRADCRARRMRGLLRRTAPYTGDGWIVNCRTCLSYSRARMMRGLLRRTAPYTGDGWIVNCRTCLSYSRARKMLGLLRRTAPCTGDGWIVNCRTCLSYSRARKMLGLLRRTAPCKQGLFAEFHERFLQPFTLFTGSIQRRGLTGRTFGFEAFDLQTFPGPRPDSYQPLRVASICGHRRFPGARRADSFPS